MPSKKIDFSLIFPENLKKDSDFSTTDALTFDDIGDFIEERQKIKRTLESALETDLKIDYSDFSNHVFFDSAVSKFNIAKSRILNNYPYNGTLEEKDAFNLTGSGYDNYILEQWPRHVGYVDFNGINQYVSASDTDNLLRLGSSSLYVSAWAKPVISGQNPVVIDTVRYQNFLSGSEEFHTEYWIKTACTASLDTSITDPIGTSTAVKIVGNSANSTHPVRQTSPVLNSNKEYIYSVYAKPGNKTWVYMEITGIAGQAFFDIENGLTGALGPFSASYIQGVGNGWYRCSGIYGAKATAFNADMGPADSNNDRVFIGDNSTTNVYLWGAQIAEKTLPNETFSNYVRTTGSILNNKVGYELYFSGTTDPYLKFNLYSGSQKVSLSSAYAAFTSSFNNISAIYDNPGDIAHLYINDQRRASGTANFGSIDKIMNKIVIGSGSSLQHASSSFDMYSGSLDEIRVLLTASELFHTKNHSRPINSEDYVALRYSFNEGVTGTGSIDQVTVDYSKNAIHGKIFNYASTSRISGTSMANDPGDLILYSFHSGVAAFSASHVNSASFYDVENNNLIFNLLPEALLREDAEQDNLLQSFSLALARFFDEIKSYIDQFDNLRITNYEDTNETPDLFLPSLKKYFGWKVTEHFGDANPLSFFFGENVLSTGSLNVPLVDVRNQFWRRVLNNLPYLLQTKGKRNNLDAFFNVLGVNKENINIKEYGYLPGGSIGDTRIHKEKVVSLLGIGTGSLSGSYVRVPSLVSASNSEYTIESLAQLPFASASYSASLSVLTGSLWQLVDFDQVTGSFSLLWNIPSLGSTTGKFVLTGSDGQYFSSSDVEVFDGDFVYVAAGLKSNQVPFIEVRTLDNDTLDLYESFTGSVAFSGVFTGSNYDFIMGATSGTFFDKKTQGFFGEYRYWNRALSSSEIDNHAFHFENVGVSDPLEAPHPLKGHWPLNENKLSDGSGQISSVLDLSRNGRTGTGFDFLTDYNTYKKFLIEYNYLSPSVDLKWTENKIRIRNKSELTVNDIAKDTNEVSLEFNLIDALNEDISKIFSTIDLINETIGSPINKYRDEYADLESLRRVYFDRLGDSLNFTRFFKLFKWFDRKLSDSIKQLLPARVKFIGGAQVVESHFLERNKYGYRFPIFRTPKDVSEGVVDQITKFSGSEEKYLSAEAPAQGTHVATIFEENNRRTSNAGLISPHAPPRGQSVDFNATLSTEFNTMYSDGEESPDRNKENFFRRKLSGDEFVSKDRLNYTANPNSGINNKNEFARRELGRLESLNFDGYSAGFKTGSFIHPKIGVNANVIKDLKSSRDNEHYLGGHKKHIKLRWNFLSGNATNNATSIEQDFVLTGSNGLAVSASLYDTNNVLLVRGDSRAGFDYEPFWFSSVFGRGASGSFDFKLLNAKISCLISSSNAVSFSLDNVDIKAVLTTPNVWESLKPYGVLTDSTKERGYKEFFIDYSIILRSITSDNAPLIVQPPVFVLSSTLPSAIYIFKNFRMDFDVALSDDGIRYFSDIDNTNTEKIFSYINVSALNKIE